MKKLVWFWKRLVGKKYYIEYVEQRLRDNEVLFYGHKIYIGRKNGKAR